jgi:hypothetical protein
MFVGKSYYDSKKV